MRALIIVDVQNDFTTGTLATAQGPAVAEAIAAWLPSTSYAHVIATQDWHIDPGAHFDEWPVHCLAESEGAAMAPALVEARISHFFRKGEYTAAYSGFEAACDGVGLEQWLREAGVRDIDVIGIATDHCVRATALDGLKAGFNVRVLREFCAAVDDASGQAALEEMRAAGAILV